MLIGKVDAEAEKSKATAQSQGVKSYPTIKFFAAGSTEAEDYSGGRSESDLVSFINSKAGTHRAIGGGLDATAGTIEALDTILSKITTGGSETITSITDEVSSAAATLQGKYAEYYGKVAAKLGKNEGYAEKELGRLEGLIKKGGLQREKMDDLVSRSNILRKFKVEAERLKEVVEEKVEEIKGEL